MLRLVLLKFKSGSTYPIILIALTLQKYFHSAQKDFFKQGFTPWKAEGPLQGMELQEKETQKD